MGRKQSKKTVPITFETTKKLRHYRNLSGVSALALIKKHKDELKDIGAEELQSWLDSYGSVVYTEQHIFDNVCRLWEQEASLKSRPKVVRVDITDEYINALSKEISRTKINISTFLRLHYRSDKPIKAAVISNWLNKQVKTADEDLLTTVLDTYKQLPNAIETEPLQTITDSTERINVDGDIKLLLQHYHQNTGILPSLIFKQSKDAPEGLNTRMVSGWLSEQTSTAQPQHISWVLQRCNEILEDAINNKLVQEYRLKHKN